MAKNYLIITTSYSKDDLWDSGDPVIYEGLLNLLPEIKNYKVVFSRDIPDDQIEEYVKNCFYIIQAGTPSWMTMKIRKIWAHAINHKKHVALLGIGLAITYYQSFWYGAEEFMWLRDSGLLDLVVCRDKYCYYWLHHKMGVDGTKITTLPCPAYYSLPPNVCHDKKKVVLSIPNPDETARETDMAFFDFRNKMVNLYRGLTDCGAEVSVIYQRHYTKNQVFVDSMSDAFGSRIHCFNSFQEFIDFTSDKEVYIGYRNHGALPIAGAGKCSLLLGTDLRQLLADETPFVSRHDVSHCDFPLYLLFDWYGSLNPEGVGYSSLNYREHTYRRWRNILAPVIQKLETGRD